uniref:Uncharacterized protein n=1 Tax=Ananas comosus var. bracteatus TaxID=296719 RepID=A0A6V7NVB7_ANACO|nr:unnamed protein product [Ananas comosus var. bracteatus]
MAEKPTAKPALQKPPGYRDPALQKPPGYRDPALPPPPQRRPPAQLHPAFRTREAAPTAPPQRRRRRTLAPARPLLRPRRRARAHPRRRRRRGARLPLLPAPPPLLPPPLRPTPPRPDLPRSDGGDAVDAATSAAVAAEDEDGDVATGAGPFGGFAQARRSATEVAAAASAASAVVVDEGVGARLRARFRSKSVRFKVEVRTRVGILVGGKGTWKVPIRVECSPVSLKRAQGDGDPIPCRIYWFKWSTQVKLRDKVLVVELKLMDLFENLEDKSELICCRLAKLHGLKN